MSVNQYEAEVASIFLQGTLYGAFVVVFFLICRTLVLCRPPEHRLNKVMMGALGTMFILATVHIVVNLVQTLQIFNGRGDHPRSYQWNRLSDPTHLTCTTIYFVQTQVGHGVALYKSWVVCSKRLTPIILPCLFFLGCIATGINQLASLSRYKDASSFTQQIWLIIFFSFALVFSTTCTLIVATRTWFLKKDRIFGNTASWTLYCTIITQIVLESGAIYSGVLVALIISLALGSWFQYAIADSMTSVVGLVFSIVIHRTRLDVATDEPRFPNIDTFVDDASSSKMNGTLPRQPISRVSRDSIALSPSRFWPVQPDRSLPYHLPRSLQGRQQRRDIKASLLDFGRRRDPPRTDGQQCHYSLRSKMAHPSSYFRASEEIGMDMELEIEMDEARLNRPKALPAALILP